MQMKRLFEIVYILLDKETVTARDLANHFEVSTRTIYRDIEALSGAGIPVYMNQGKGGGIRLISGYVLNKSILTDEEQRQIMTALQGMKAMNSNDGDDVIKKLSVMFHKPMENWIEVDFSDWNNQNAEQFNILKEAILTHQVLEFEYYGRDGKKTNRKVEPYKLVFKQRNWYLIAFCQKRQETRIFKLSRMQRIHMSTKQFEPSQEVEANSRCLIPETADENNTRIVLIIDASSAYRVYDEFYEDQIQKLVDGSFKVTLDYPVDEWVYGYLLSFGSHVKIVEPAFVREELRHRLQDMITNYNG